LAYRHAAAPRATGTELGIDMLASPFDGALTDDGLMHDKAL